MNRTEFDQTKLVMPGQSGHYSFINVFQFKLVVSVPERCY